MLLLDFGFVCCNIKFSYHIPSASGVVNLCLFLLLRLYRLYTFYEFLRNKLSLTYSSVIILHFKTMIWFNFIIYFSHIYLFIFFLVIFAYLHICSQSILILFLFYYLFLDLYRCKNKINSYRKIISKP